MINMDEVRELIKNPPKKRKDCKHYFRGHCDLLYRIHGQMQGYSPDSRKHGWKWRCYDFRLGRPCENYTPKEKKDDGN